MPGNRGRWFRPRKSQAAEPLAISMAFCTVVSLQLAKVPRGNIRTDCELGRLLQPTRRLPIHRMTKKGHPTTDYPSHLVLRGEAIGLTSPTPLPVKQSGMYMTMVTGRARLEDLLAPKGMPCSAAKYRFLSVVAGAQPGDRNPPDA